MRTTIDGAGRIVVPKALRDELGLTAGQELELRAVDGGLEVEVPATPMRLVERDGDLVAEAEGEMPELTPGAVRQTLEQTRR
jgi:AbrB family looped-hinge helix DNA binding protein